MELPLPMRGKAARQAAAAAARKWRQLRFDDLRERLRAPHTAELRLPIAGVAAAAGRPAPYLALALRTNAAAWRTWLALEHFGFLRLPPPPTTPSSPRPRPLPPPPLGTTELTVHAGPPRGLGYPAALQAETTHWTAAVLDAAASGRPSPPFPPTRWLLQPLLEGVVGCRVQAHAGAAEEALLRPLRALAEGVQQAALPPYQVSPFYATDALRARWGLFASPDHLLPRPTRRDSQAKEVRPGDAVGHLRRAEHLALAGALLPAFRGVWLRGAVLGSTRPHPAPAASSSSAAASFPAPAWSVLILGPRRAGKTTLALHVLAASPRARLGAADGFFCCAGDEIAALLGRPPAGAARQTDTPAEASVATPGEPPAPRPFAPSSRAVFLASVPGSVTVGLGALVGSLAPNPALTAHVQPALLANPDALPALLRNPEGVLWQMGQQFRVHVEEAFPPSPACRTAAGGDDDAGGDRTRWRPAALGPIRAVVLLDWDLTELFRPGPVPVRSAVEKQTLREAWPHFARLHETGALVLDHHLLRGVYDGAGDGLETLQHILASGEGGAIEVFRLVGSVNFPLATGLVVDLLNS